MRTFICTLMLVVVAASVGQAQLALKSKKDSISYGIGYDIGRNFNNQGALVNVDALMRGFRDAYGGKQSTLPQDKTERLLQDFSQEMMNKQAERTRMQAEENKKKGDAFLAENKKKPGVVTLPSGLQYKIVTEGTGPKPSKDTTVVCHYRGTLIDGTEFDSSYKRGEPATFRVAQVIRGWQEVLQLMPVGSKWQVFVPSALAYGERGAGERIGPNAALIFDIELVAIK